MKGNRTGRGFKFTTDTGRAANKKIKKRHKWTPAEARHWGRIAVIMRSLK